MRSFSPVTRTLTLLPGCVLLVVALAAGEIQAQAGGGISAASPAGQWKTIDDHTGKAKSIVAIREVNGELHGTIATLIDPPDPHPTCKLCSGALKDRPLVGLEILWGFRRDGDQWTGGRVLDPETGKIYQATLGLEEGGRKLKVRGFIGISLLGRTQYWIRTE